MLTNDIISEEANENVIGRGTDNSFWRINSANENVIGQLLKWFENELEKKLSSNKRELKDYRLSKTEEVRITVKRLWERQGHYNQ